MEKKKCATFGLEDFAIFDDFAILEAWLGDLEGLTWFTICWLTFWRLDYGALYLFWRLGWFDDSWRITLWRILLYLEDFAIFGDFAIVEAWLGDLEGLSWLLFVG